MTYDTLVGGTLDQPAGQVAGENLLDTSKSLAATNQHQEQTILENQQSDQDDEQSSSLTIGDSTSIHETTSSCSSSSIEITTNKANNDALLAIDTAPSSNETTHTATTIAKSSNISHHNAQHLPLPKLISVKSVPQLSTPACDSTDKISILQDSSVTPSTTIAQPTRENGIELARPDNNNVDDDGDDSKSIPADHSPIPADEIRARLDRLNALSDLINSLEQQSNESNRLFNRTLKQSTDRLSSIAKALGNKSIRHGRVYYAAKIAVEKSQSECQRACVQFEQATKDHQIAKRAIQEAESKLKEIASEGGPGAIQLPGTTTTTNTTPIDCMRNLKLSDENENSSSKQPTPNGSELLASCDSKLSQPGFSAPKIGSSITNSASSNLACKSNDGVVQHLEDKKDSPASSLNQNAAKLSEQLNQAIVRLLESEKKRGISQQQHLDRANKLMLEQENLLRLEREHGPSIKRSEFYFNEARQFDARLNSVKSEITRLNGDILTAKSAYAQTLRELELFSEKLHQSGQVPPPTP